MADKKRTNKKEKLSKEYKTKNKKPQTKKKRIIKKVLLAVLIILLILAGIAFGIICKIMREAKLTAKDFAIKNENSIVLDKDGNQIAELSGSENRKSNTGRKRFNKRSCRVIFVWWWIYNLHNTR